MQYTLSGDDNDEIDEDGEIVQQSFYAYVEPDISSFYMINDENSNKVRHQMAVERHDEDMAGRFINMSNQLVTLYWYV
jgi:hypothetical protein